LFSLICCLISSIISTGLPHYGVNNIVNDSSIKV
jgi:hypothetical protein